MRAARFHEFGPPDVLRVEERPDPELPDDGLLVRVAAAALNPVDLEIRAGHVSVAIAGTPPRGLGADLAGTVVRAGRDVQRYAVGDRVMAMLPAFKGEAYAEFAVVPEAAAAPWPEGVTAAEAAGTPLVTLTALQGLRSRGGLRAKHRVLIHGASGGVGSMAVQVGRRFGAHVVGTASAPHLDLVRELGAHEAVDYAAEDVTRRDGFDIVFDVAGTLPFAKARPMLRPTGAYVTTRVTPGVVTRTVLQKAMPGPTMAFCQVGPDGETLEGIQAVLAAGSLRTVVDRTYALEDAAEAHRYLAEQTGAGKVVLIVDPEQADPPETDTDAAPEASSEAAPDADG